MPALDDVQVLYGHLNAILGAGYADLGELCQHTPHPALYIAFNGITTPTLHLSILWSAGRVGGLGFSAVIVSWVCIFQSSAKFASPAPPIIGKAHDDAQEAGGIL